MPLLNATRPFYPQRQIRSTGELAMLAMLKQLPSILQQFQRAKDSKMDRALSELEHWKKYGGAKTAPEIAKLADAAKIDLSTAIAGANPERQPGGTFQESGGKTGELGDKIMYTYDSEKIRQVQAYAKQAQLVEQMKRKIREQFREKDLARKREDARVEAAGKAEGGQKVAQEMATLKTKETKKLIDHREQSQKDVIDYKAKVDATADPNKKIKAQQDLDNAQKRGEILDLQIDNIRNNTDFHNKRFFDLMEEKNLIAYDLFEYKKIGEKQVGLFKKFKVSKEYKSILDEQSAYSKSSAEYKKLDKQLKEIRNTNPDLKMVTDRLDRQGFTYEATYGKDRFSLDLDVIKFETDIGSSDYVTIVPTGTTAMSVGDTDLIDLNILPSSGLNTSTTYATQARIGEDDYYDYGYEPYYNYSTGGGTPTDFGYQGYGM